MATKSKFNIAVLPGDGIGIDVTAEAVRVLRYGGYWAAWWNHPWADGEEWFEHCESLVLWRGGDSARADGPRDAFNSQAVLIGNEVSCAECTRERRGHSGTD